MKNTIAETWRLPEAIEPEALFAELGKRFVIAYEPPVNRTITFSDTFDWRLYKSNYVLFSSANTWTLTDRKTGEIVVQQEGPKLNRRCFAGDFEHGGVKKILTPILEMRSVLPLFTAEITAYTVRILNKDEKTVARLFIEQHSLENVGEIIQGVSLEPVRGYVKEQEAVTRFFAEYETMKTPLLSLDLESGSRAEGKTPGDYSSKFVLRLDPDQTACSAVVSIYKQLLETMHTNIPGTIADLDSEFLHDLRVAVRRTRSGLSLIKNVIDPMVVEKYKEAFAYIGKITGPTRDLDVYLLEEETYKSRLPETLQIGLHSFFEDLVVERKAAQKNLVRELQGETVENILSSWGDYLDAGDLLPAKKSDLPVIELARKIIYKRYRRVMNDGLSITDHTPDTEIHRLRIQGKKLRYAIEFFSSLFPEKEIQSAVKRLKRLQNFLGDFNDLSVQQEMLSAHLQKLRPGSRRTLEEGAALGGLMSYLYLEQLKARKEFAEVFGGFSGQGNIELFERLFN